MCTCIQCSFVLSLAPKYMQTHAHTQAKLIKCTKCGSFVYVWSGTIINRIQHRTHRGRQACKAYTHTRHKRCWVPALKTCSSRALVMLLLLHYRCSLFSRVLSLVLQFHFSFLILNLYCFVLDAWQGIYCYFCVFLHSFEWNEFSRWWCRCKR